MGWVYDSTFNAAGLQWTENPNLGHSNAAILAQPQGRPSTSIEDQMRLEHNFIAIAAANIQGTIQLVPSLDIRGKQGIRFGISVDERRVKTLVSNLIPTAGVAINFIGMA